MREHMFVHGRSSIGRPRGGDAAVAARLRVAPGLAAEDYYALAGFFDAEGHFGISAARAPKCSASIGLRDDDAGVVVRLREATGLGHVTAVPARGRSKPQVQWRIETKRECRALAAILMRYPLLGRKRREAAVWSRAVCRWSESSGQSRTSDLVEARDVLLSLRRYDPSPQGVDESKISRTHLVGHFGGFFSGDGSFSLNPDRRRAQMLVRLRRDDAPLLRLYTERFGFGRVIPVAPGVGQKPIVLWHVTARADLAKALDVLDEAPLLGLKRTQYAAWRPAAAELVRASRDGSPVDQRILVAARRRLDAIRRYEPPRSRVTTERFRDGCDHRQVYADVLRTWAASCGEAPLPCTAYVQARRANPTWPTRGTLVANFGSWYGALAAAGLEKRAVRRAKSHRLTE